MDVTGSDRSSGDNRCGRWRVSPRRGSVGLEVLSWVLMVLALICMFAVRSAQRHGDSDAELGGIVLFLLFGVPGFIMMVRQKRRK